MTHDMIQAVLARIPTLTRFGMGLYAGGATRTPAERAQALAMGRAALLAGLETCALVCQWLAPMGQRQTINIRHSSYGLKHLAEAELDHYVANGTFIAAALHCGFRLQHIPGSPNVRFNLSERDITAAARRVAQARRAYSSRGEQHHE